jgi:hypothetical protein
MQAFSHKFSRCCVWDFLNRFFKKISGKIKKHFILVHE